MRRILFCFLILLMAGCCKKKTGDYKVAPGVEPTGQALILQAQAEEDVIEVAKVLAALENGLTTLLDPEAREERGYVFEPDPDPEAPPGSHIYEVPFDSDGDGANDALISGTVILSLSSILRLEVGLTGESDMVIDMGDDGIIEGHIDFKVDPDGVRVWGSGAKTHPALREVTEFTAFEEDPIHIPLVAGEDPNVCVADIQGPLEVRASESMSIYTAILRFLFGSSEVSFTEVTFSAGEAEEEEPTQLKDHSTQLPSCHHGDINDWAGIYLLNWYCQSDGGLEGGTGDSRLTFTVTGPNTVHVSDEHPIGSGLTLEYDLTADEGNPHVLRGFFEENDGPGTYREDVVYTLNPEGQYWIQNNVYLYLDGELAGTGGTCSGSGHRLDY